MGTRTLGTDGHQNSVSTARHWGFMGMARQELVLQLGNALRVRGVPKGS